MLALFESYHVKHRLQLNPYYLLQKKDADYAVQKNNNNAPAFNTSEIIITA